MNKYDYRISTVDLKTDLLIVFLSLINSYTRNIIIFYITLKIISHINNNYYKNNNTAHNTIQRHVYILKICRRI